MLRRVFRSEVDWPAVTCLCPTCGRFERLRDAAACFIFQDYPGEMCLSILNDAPDPILLTADGADTVEMGSKARIILKNAPPFPNFGQKKQALLDSAQTEIVAHWDDDDLALPWHLSTIVRILIDNPKIECVKPVWAWPVTGAPGDLRVYFPCQKRYDGQMVFRRGTAALYKDAMRRTALPLLDDYRNRGVLNCPSANSRRTRGVSYVFRSGDNMRHLSRSGSDKIARRYFARRNRDFGGGQPLLPDRGLAEWARGRLWGQFKQIVEGWKTVKIRSGDRKAITEQLLKAIEGTCPIH